MSKYNELNDFRVEWLNEIRTTKQPAFENQPSHHDKTTENNDRVLNNSSGDPSPGNNDNQIFNKSNDRRAETCNDHKLTLSSPCSGGGDDYEAFKIANKYLNISDTKNCKHCYSKNGGVVQNTDSPNIVALSSKRKRDSCFGKSSKKKTMFDHGENSLLDVLIADIDEITTVPFFDNELPKEIAVKIFRHLSLVDLARCALVSKQWQRIAEDDFIWFKVHQRFCCDAGSDSISLQQQLVLGDRENWKKFVKSVFLEKRAMRKKWRERLCQVRNFENEKGGVLCAADICEEKIVVAYLDGSIRMWDLCDGAFGHNLKEPYTRDEDIVTASCTKICLSPKYCVAAFQNGDVMIWRVLDSLTGKLVYMVNYPISDISLICISECNSYVAVIADRKARILTCSNPSADSQNEQAGDDAWRWMEVYEKEFTEKITNFTLSHTDDVIISTKHRLFKQNIHDGSEVVMDEVAGAVISCLDRTNKWLVAGVNSFGYSVLGGFRLRSYCISTGRQLTNIVGTQCRIDCIRVQDGCRSCAVIGCSDGIIRVYNLNNSDLMTSLNSRDAPVVSLQMDDWKILCGHSDGTVVLWDRNSAVVCWQTEMKHPVHVCQYNERLLTSVNIPVDKFPKNSNWYVGDLVQDRKYRGSIRVMDFSKDTTRAAMLPEELCADYDNIAGYDYNIQLVAPYDVVEDDLNLPRI